MLIKSTVFSGVFIPQIGRDCQTINLPAFRPVRRMKESLPRDVPFHRIFPEWHHLSTLQVAPVASLKNVTEGGEILDNVAS
jgi:hypothetical protein